MEFIALLAARRVYLAGEGGALKFRAPDGAMDEDLRKALRQHKDSLLSALRECKGHLLFCPLSYNQHSLFFLHLLEPASAAYNLALSMRLRSSVAPAALCRALERLVRRHEQLRTTYAHVDLGDALVPCQCIHEEMAPEFQTIDARDWTEAELAERIRGFYRTPLDLEKGPVVRAGLFLRGPSDTVLIVVIHHIAADGWSMNRICRDLAAAYREESGAGRCGDEAAGAAYVEFALEQHQALAEPAGQVHLDYWVAVHTPPAPPLDLGGEARRPAARRSVGGTHHFRLEPLVREAVERVARELKITSFALLLSVFQWLLFERSRRRDVVVGIPTLGHKDRRFEETVGYFVNPVPLRCRRSGSLRFREHARNTARELSEALDHRDAPFAAVVERLGGARDAERTPVFQVLFNLLSRKTLGDVIDLLYPLDAPPVVDFGGLNAEAIALDQQEGQFDLTLELVDRGGEILGLLKYCTDLFTAADAANMATEYSALLESALANADAALFPESGKADGSVVPGTSESVVSVAATFTAEVFQEFFEFWFRQLGWRTGMSFAPLNQVFQELLNPAGLLCSNRRGQSVVLVRLEDLLRGGGAEDGNDGLVGVAARLPAVLDDLGRAVETAAQAIAVPLCIVLCPSSPRGEAILHGKVQVVEHFLDALRHIPGVAVLTHEEVVRRYPVADYYEDLGETMGLIPYTRPYIAALATTVVRTLHSLSNKPMKALVLDCDGTLWDGVAAEDGPTGVSVGPWAQRFQEFLLEQYRAGVTLCICSKNREDDVWAVFDQHPGMVLRRDHISFWRIDWEAKSANLRALAAEMKIGLDAMVLLDDNPLECAEVRSNCPAVLCAPLPAAWPERVAWLEHLWVLDHAAVTIEDRKRQEYYRSARLREEFTRSASSLSEFLEQLNLRVDLRPAETPEFERLSQLSVRTNQFNTTTLRLSVREIAAYATTPGQTVHLARVSDRFGDYGLVGGLLTRAARDVLRVEGFYLSCRALARGVEHLMASYLGTVAVQAGFAWVEFPSQTTNRNEPARSFLAQLAGLCSGSVDSEGTLRVGAGNLVGVRYIPMEVPAAVPAIRDPGETILPEVSLQRDTAARIADVLRSVDAIVAAVDGEIRARRSRTRARETVGTVEPPATMTEKVIAETWKRTLGFDEVGTSENFFELGGTSLLLARVAIELQRDHGLKVSIVDLFQFPTIAGLARHLGLNGSGGSLGAPVASRAQHQREQRGGQGIPATYLRLKQARGK